MLNYYSILGVSESATAQEIKAAFKKLAVLYHPDKNPGKPEMEERFKEVNEAYQILSHPYEKARYDIKLKYGFYAPPEQPSYEYQPTPSQNQHRRRRQYVEPQINWRENWIATGYAFGFTFIIACLVMTVIFIKRQIDQDNFEQLLQSRRTSFNEIQKLYASGEIEPALQRLNNLGGFIHEYEQDMESYKVSLYQGFMSNAESGYFEHDYPKAIYFYELIEKYSPFKPIKVKEHLAESYERNHQPQEAIKKMKELLILGQASLTMYLHIARIYRDQLHNSQEALRYLKLADVTTINQYRSFYGDAYGLVISASLLPRSHYELYTELAQGYLDADSAAKAVKVTEWNIHIWPDSIPNYVIAANGCLRLGQESRACDYFTKARKLGYRNTPTTCQN